ncbi:right-handed parallel beta-helix repeat-containing protein [bacterium]|nr:right-handed parallel beta-helix repeat-containing protein [bacterium]
MKKFFLTILFLLLGIHSYAETYYVSYSEGNDANNGLSASNAFKTTSRIEWLTKTGNDKILFKRGDNWLAEDYPVYLRGPTVTNTKLDYYGAYGQGEMPVLGRINLTNNLILNGLHIKDDGGDGDRFKTVLYKVNNVIIQNCFLEGDNEGNTLQIVSSGNIIILNCIITGGNDAAVSIANSHDVIVQNSHLSGRYNGVVIFRSGYQYECYNNLIRNNTCVSLAVGGGAAIELGWGGIKENIVYGNICYGNNYGLFISGHNNLVFNNIICDIGHYNLVVGIRLTGVKAPKWQKKWDCSNNYLYNNTVVTKGIALNIDGNYPGVYNNTLINNIFYSQAKALLWIRNNGRDNLRNSVKMDYNLWYHPSGLFKIRWGYPKYMQYTFKEYKALSGQDANGFFADPLLDKDFKPSSSSKCIDNGLKLKIFSFDFKGKKRIGKWDIGACRFDD